MTLHLGCLMNFSPFEGLTNCHLVEVFFFTASGKRIRDAAFGLGAVLFVSLVLGS